MGKIAYFVNLHKENSSGIPTQWIHENINPVYKLILANQFKLNHGMSFELELLNLSSNKQYLIAAQKVLGSNPAGGGIRLMTVRYSIAKSLSLSPFYHLNMT